MAMFSRPYRLVNPGRRHKNRFVKGGRTDRDKKRKLTLRQKLFFGSKRQRAAARAQPAWKFPKPGASVGRKRKRTNAGKLASSPFRKYKREAKKWSRSHEAKMATIRRRAGYGEPRKKTNAGKKNERHWSSSYTRFPFAWKPIKKTKKRVRKSGNRRKPNVGSILTVFNPERKVKMKHRRRLSGFFGRKRRYTRRGRGRSNPVASRRRRYTRHAVAHVYRRRRGNPGRRIRHYSQRRNPGFLTGTAGKIVGVLGGAALTSLLTSTLAGSVSAVASGIPLYIAGAVIAFLQGKLVDKFMHNAVLGENMQIGGYTFVVLTMLHDLVPSLPNPFANLSGLGLLTSSNNWGPPWVNTQGSMTRFVRPGGAVAAFPAPIAPASGMHGFGRLRRGGRLA